MANLCVRVASAAVLMLLHSCTSPGIVQDSQLASDDSVCHQYDCYGFTDDLIADGTPIPGQCQIGDPQDCDKSNGGNCLFNCTCHGSDASLTVCSTQISGSAHCVTLASDPQNCGACGVVCSNDCCKGSCTALNTDPSNCGSCGNVCGANTVCRQGKCVECATDADCTGTDATNDGGYVKRQCADNTCKKGKEARCCYGVNACNNSECASDNCQMYSDSSGFYYWKCL
jgi:hypothetical protein